MSRGRSRRVCTMRFLQRQLVQFTHNDVRCDHHVFVQLRVWQFAMGMQYFVVTSAATQLTRPLEKPLVPAHNLSHGQAALHGVEW